MVRKQNLQGRKNPHSYLEIGKPLAYNCFLSKHKKTPPTRNLLCDLQKKMNHFNTPGVVDVLISGEKNGILFVHSMGNVRAKHFVLVLQRTPKSHLLGLKAAMFFVAYHTLIQSLTSAQNKGKNFN